MLDVHPPHEKIHGFRDFLLHLLTITIGLLIALGLEGLVEWRHHNHLRAEADENMRHEIEDNRKELATVRQALGTERNNIMNVLKYLQARTQNQPYNATELTVAFQMGGFRNASWSSASATGALSFMDYAHVQTYANAYSAQTEFGNLQRQTLQTVLNLEAYFVGNFDPKTFPIADAQAAEAQTRLALSQLNAIDQIGSSLDTAYAEVLK